jgi:uncharacterized protein DUF3520/protein with von Willebrand factor-like domain
MKSSSHLSENPRLTAYALGELDVAEAAQIEAEIKGDQGAQEMVAEIRALANDLEAALANETAEAVPLNQVAWADDSSVSPSKITPFPIWILAGAAAACFAFVLAVHSISHSKVTTIQPSVATEMTAKADPAKTASKSDAGRTAEVHLRELVPDGFSDLKPAPFREGGYRLGKSVADASSSDLSSLSIDPDFRSRSTSAIAMDKSEFSPSLNYGSAQNAGRLSALVYNRESYAFQTATGFSGVAGFPLSIFFPNDSTSSYQSVVSYLQSGRLPPPDAVKVEELLNYFSYGSAASKADASLAASIEVAAAPWNPAHRLVRIGLTGRDALASDVSGRAVAKDLKLQVEFNPEQAKSYRLIGYDEAKSPQVASTSPGKVEGGEMEAGHVVTALYEVVPVTPGDSATVDGDPLRYAASEGGADSRHRELLTLKIRYRLPVVDVTRKMEIPLIDPGTEFAVASKDFKFSAAVARFGMILKETPRKSASTYDQVLSWAEDGRDKNDKTGKQHEFIDLVKKAKTATVE